MMTCICNLPYGDPDGFGPCPVHDDQSSDYDCTLCLDAQVIYQPTTHLYGSDAALMPCPRCTKETQ